MRMMPHDNTRTCIYEGMSDKLLSLGMRFIIFYTPMDTYDNSVSFMRKNSNILYYCSIGYLTIKVIDSDKGYFYSTSFFRIVLLPNDSIHD